MRADNIWVFNYTNDDDLQVNTHIENAIATTLHHIRFSTNRMPPKFDLPPPILPHPTPPTAVPRLWTPPGQNNSAN
ncbi:hypothetical protein M501DRAFT_1001369 [Patellaria atrata CBS 101060]|uniref:Uncharacterized protein n=1 Tax=Patellaria atrata CBS 101060 TaxID=1346257 RepID=A0A9P4S0T5_9PEZI|nr:hypothetical protein M501DRAFT_1001369 [Patellaria atrata CBS 101060]